MTCSPTRATTRAPVLRTVIGWSGPGILCSRAVIGLSSCWELGPVRGSDQDQRNGSAPSLGARPGRPHTRSYVDVPAGRPGDGGQPFRLDLNSEQALAPTL